MSGTYDPAAPLDPAPISDSVSKLVERIAELEAQLGGVDRRREVAAAVERIKGHTDLPVCVGFGVKTAEQARAIGSAGDGVVVGSAIVSAQNSSRSS